MKNPHTPKEQEPCNNLSLITKTLEQTVLQVSHFSEAQGPPCSLKPSVLLPALTIVA